MGPRWQTRLDFDPQSASEMTSPEVPWQFQGVVKRPRSGWLPKSWKSLSPPQNSWNNPHSLAYVITQPVKTNHAKFGGCICLCDGPQSVCGVCFSLYLNKSTSYLSFCLPLNSFCDKTSRTWASLGSETRYHGFWLGLSSSPVGSSPKQGFGWV